MKRACRSAWPAVLLGVMAGPVLLVSGPLLPSLPAGLTVTTYATGLDFPTSMTPMSDGSLLVGTTAPDPGSTGQFSFYLGSGELVRLASSSGTGPADSAIVVATGLPGAVSSVRQIGPLIAVATVGNTTPGGFPQGDITFLKPGAHPMDPYTTVGSIHIQESVNTLTVLPLGVSAGTNGSYSVYFGIGADNTGTPIGTVSFSGLVSAANQPTGSIYQMTVNTNGPTPTISGLQQVANGIRNTGGILVDPAGNVYFGDNGYETAGGVPVSADELNLLTAAQIASGNVTSFGYPNSYTSYADGSFVGGTGVPALWPYLGQSFGINELAFMPTDFPAGFNDGILAGFDGNYNHSGTLNTTNPAVLYNLLTGVGSNLIDGGQAGVGHLIGLASTDNSLFLADLSSADGWIPGSGVIYEISSFTSVPEPSSAALVFTALASAAALRRRVWPFVRRDRRR